MKKMLMSLILALIFMAAPALADPPSGGVHDVIQNNNQTATGGAGGSATVGDISNRNTNTNFNTNLNTNSNYNSNRNENRNTNLNVNEGNRQGQGQAQGQGQGQSQLNEGNKVNIENPQQYLAIPSVGVAELNFGNGNMVLNIAKALPKFGIPLLTPEDEIKEIVDITANVPFKKLYKTILEMKKDQEPLGYNVKIQIVMMEGQKSWTTGGSVSGAGSYVGNAGSAGSASLIPSVGGTKAQPLFTIILVKVTR